MVALEWGASIIELAWPGVAAERAGAVGCSNGLSVLFHTGKCMMRGEQSGKLSRVIVDLMPIRTFFNRRKRARVDAGILFEALMSSSVTES
jgi:hypothetical protein